MRARCGGDAAAGCGGGRDDADGGETIEAALIDFQFAGFGLAATDVAHFLCGAVAPDALVRGGDARLIDGYHAALCEARDADGAWYIRMGCRKHETCLPHERGSYARMSV